jgi:hypothetical protein
MVTFNSSISLNDPNASSDSQDGSLQAALTQALANWSNYISGVGTLIVQLIIDTTTGYATGGPTSSVNGGQSGGLTIETSSAVNELKTGNHAASSDITINFNYSALASVASYGQAYLVATFEHELMHGFGMVGYRAADGTLSGFASPFDVLSVDQGTVSDVFTGAAAMYVYGGPVPLTTQYPGANFYHLGATASSADPPILYTDIMEEILTPGKSISALDVAILDDIGVPLTAAGYQFIYPAPNLTAQPLATNGLVTSPLISGTTQPGEQVTLSENGVVIATTIANAAGAWSIDPTGLADGAHTLIASVPDASHAVTYGVGIVLDATSPVQAIYTQVLGRAADAGGLAGYRLQLLNGASVAAIRTTVAQGVESETDIGQIYAATLGRWVEQASLVGLVNYLAAGGTQAAIRVNAADSVESETDIGKIYAAALGRWVDQASLVGIINNIAAGETQAAERAAVGHSAEAAAAINSLYTSILGRAGTTVDITGWQGFLAAGSSLSILRSQLASSGEAANDINAIYTGILGRSGSTADITGWQGFFAAGSSLAALRSAAATGGESASDINAFAQTALGHTVDAATLSTYQQTEVNGGSLAGVKLAIATGAEVSADINAAFALEPSVTPPNAVEIAGDQSELLAGVTLTTLQAQIAELSGGAAPRQLNLQLGATISPVTVGTASPSFVYGLLHNDALLAPQPESVLISYAGAGGQASLFSFNPSTDVIQLHSQQAANFAAVETEIVGNGPSTIINLHGSGGDIYLANIAPTSLTANNFRFV